jgi:hypothetical protein
MSLSGIKGMNSREIPGQLKVPKIRTSSRCITPQNEGLLLNLFEFLAAANSTEPDLYLKKVVERCLVICSKFEFEGYPF